MRAEAEEDARRRARRDETRAASDREEVRRLRAALEARLPTACIGAQWKGVGVRVCVACALCSAGLGCSVHPSFPHKRGWGCGVHVN